MPFSLAGLFKGGVKDVVDSVGKVLDNVITTKDELEAAKLKMAEEINRNFEALQAQANEMEKAYLADTQNARARETEFVKSTGHADYFKYVIGGLAVILMIFMVVFLLNREVPQKNEHVVMLVIGEVLGITTSIYAFYYGSYQGSRNKDRKP